MMKTLLISIILFFSHVILTFSQDTSVLMETYGKYRLKYIGAAITDQEALGRDINWFYKNKYDTIILGKDKIIFGDYVENNPTYNILYKDGESTVELIIGNIIEATLLFAVIFGVILQK